MKLAMLSKKTRGGTGKEQLRCATPMWIRQAIVTAAPFFATMMLMRGTQKHTRQQIQDELDKIKTRLMPSPVGVNGARFSFETSRENLPAAMGLIAEILRQPSYPENEFEQAKQSSLAAYEQALRDPQSIGSSVVRQHLAQYPKGDIRRVRLPDEEIEELKATTLDEVKKFYASSSEPRIRR